MMKNFDSLAAPQFIQNHNLQVGEAAIVLTDPLRRGRSVVHIVYNLGDEVMVVPPFERTITAAEKDADGNTTLVESVQTTSSIPTGGKPLGLYYKEPVQDADGNEVSKSINTQIQVISLHTNTQTPELPYSMKTAKGTIDLAPANEIRYVDILWTDTHTGEETTYTAPQELIELIDKLGKSFLTLHLKGVLAAISVTGAVALAGAIKHSRYNQ